MDFVELLLSGLVLTAAAFFLFLCSPICLEEIRRKLDENNSNHYRDIQSFVNDVRLIFKNSLLYHNVSLG